MKKILALITAFFMSLSTSTNYTVVSDKAYTTDTYQVTDTAMPDYRAYFLGGDGVSSSSGCQTINFNSNARPVGFGMGVWFVDGATPNASNKVDAKCFKAKLYEYDDKGKRTGDHEENCSIKVEEDGNTYSDAYVKSGMFLDGQYIIAPFKCTLESKSISGSVTSMNLRCDVGANTYRIKIYNMKCWYCDINRTGDYTFHTSDEQCGKTFSQGNVLGVATPETYVKITPINSAGTAIGHCSMLQFYNGTYTKYKKPKD